MGRGREVVEVPKDEDGGVRGADYGYCLGDAGGDFFGEEGRVEGRVEMNFWEGEGERADGG